MPIDEFLYRKQNVVDSRFAGLPTSEVFNFLEIYLKIQKSLFIAIGRPEIIV